MNSVQMKSKLKKCLQRRNDERNSSLRKTQTKKSAKTLSVDQLRRQFLDDYAPKEKRTPDSPQKTGSPVGRPPQLNNKLKQLVCLLVSLGMSRRKAATIIGCNPSTISHAAKRSKVFAEQLQKAKGLAELDSFSKEY